MGGAGKCRICSTILEFTRPESINYHLSHLTRKNNLLVIEPILQSCSVFMAVALDISDTGIALQYLK